MMGFNYKKSKEKIETIITAARLLGYKITDINTLDNIESGNRFIGLKLGNKRVSMDIISLKNFKEDFKLTYLNISMNEVNNFQQFSSQNYDEKFLFNKIISWI